MDGDYLVKLRKFAANYPVVYFEKNELLETGDERTNSNSFYFILSGFVRLYVERKSGEMLSIEIDSEGDIVPFIFNTASVKGCKLNTIRIDCLSDVKANKIPGDDLYGFFEQNRDIFYYRIKEALLYTDHFLTIAPIIIYGNTGEKLAKFLQDLVNEYGVKKDGRLFIKPSLTHKDIASFIGSTREATSRELGKLRKAKVIAYSKHIIEILDKDELKKIADN